MYIYIIIYIVYMYIYIVYIVLKILRSYSDCWKLSKLSFTSRIPPWLIYVYLEDHPSCQNVWVPPKKTCLKKKLYTPLKTNEYPLKIDAWFRRSGFLLGPSAYFHGRTVSFREGKKKTYVENSDKRLQQQKTFSGPKWRTLDIQSYLLRWVWCFIAIILGGSK